MVQRHDCLDETGRAGRSLGVADLGFHTSQCDVLFPPVFLPKEVLERLHLGRVSRLGSCAVCLDQSDRRWVNPGVFVGPSESLGLPFGSRVVDARKSAVTRGTDAANDGVDSVLVPLRVLEALQGHYADAFPDHHAAGIDVKG